MSPRVGAIKDLRRYVAQASKGTALPDSEEVRARLNAIPVDALQAYWQDLQHRLALRHAQAVPDHRAREQQNAFLEAILRYAWTVKPGEDEAESLRAHLSQVVLLEITTEQQRRAEFRALPWYSRVHIYWAMAIAAAMFLAWPLMFFGDHTWKQFERVMTVAWGAFLGVGLLIAMWRSWRRKQHE